MANWKAKIRLRHLLTEAETPEAIKALADGAIAAVANTGCPITYFNKAKAMADTDAETALLLVNEAMSRLYDWADENRVWVQ